MLIAPLNLHVRGRRGEREAITMKLNEKGERKSNGYGQDDLV